MKENPEFFGLLKQLFEAKKCLRVRVTHGSSEAGRDVVMDQVTDGDELHIAVVAKSRKITGNAAVGKGSASEIYYQIRQCFGQPTIELASLSSRQVDQVIVITTKSYTEDSLRSLQSTCGTDWSGLVSFWDGDQLWSEIQRYLGPASVIAAIQEVVERVANFDDHYMLLPFGARRSDLGSIGFVESQGVRLEIVEKYPGASSVSPFRFTLKTKGETAQNLANLLMRGGGGLSVPTGGGEVVYPNLLQMMTEGTELRELRIIPNSPVGMPSNVLKLTAVDKSGHQETFAPICLTLDPITGRVSNVQQLIPLLVELVMGDEPGMQVGIECPDSGCTASDLIAALKFLNVWSQAIVVFQHNLTTGNSGSFKGPGDAAPPLSGLSELITDLDICITHSASPLRLDGPLESVTIRELRYAASLLRCEARTEFDFSCDLASGNALLSTFKDGAALQLNYRASLTCLGELIGPFDWTLRCDSAKVERQPTSEDSFGMDLRILALPGCEIRFQFRCLSDPP